MRSLGKRGSLGILRLLTRVGAGHRIAPGSPIPLQARWCAPEDARCTLLVTLGLALVVSAFAIGGDLAPPAGPIAPTFKTLDEVPTSTAVNAANTPGDAGAVYVITEPGHYHLTEDLQGVPGKGGIRIEAQDFVLDLNGHAVLGADGTRVGIDWRVPENPLDFDEIAQRGAVKNGAVRGWSLGVQMFGLGVVEDLLIRDNTSCGVSMSSALVRRCTLFDNADYGIFAQGGAERIEDCLIVGGTIGIRAERPCFISGCVIVEPAQAGIRLWSRSQVENTTIISTPLGIDMGSFNNDIRGCDLIGTLIRVTSGSTVEGCTFRSGDDAITILGDDVVVHDNQFLTSGATRPIGREGDPVRCVITNNTLQTGGENPVITDLDPATNLVGPTITPANIATVSSPLANAIITAPFPFRTESPEAMPIFEDAWRERNPR